MSHAGTMDLGGSARTKQSGSPWLAVALILAVTVAAIGAVWFASSAGLVGSAAKPAADRSYDAIEAQRGAVVVTTTAGLMTGKAADDISMARGAAYDQIEAFRGLAAQSLAATAKAGGAAGTDIPFARGYAYNQVLERAALIEQAQLAAQQDVSRLPFLVTTAPVAPELTSGTFHVDHSGYITPLGNLTTIDNPAKRDRVGGP
jgi:hypothetical protein